MLQLPYRLLSILLVALLVACSGSPNGGPGPDPEPDPDPDPPPPVIVRDDVRVLEPDAAEDLAGFALDTTAGDGELRFRADSPALEALEPGRVVVSGPVPGVAPHGFLQRIEAKRVEGEEVVLETTQATLLDTFERARIRFSQELEPDDLVDAHAYYEGVTFTDASTGLEPQASTGFAFTLSFDEVLIDADGDDGTTDDQLRVDGTFSFDATASADIDIDCCESLVVPYLDRFASKIELNESVDVSLTGELATGFDERFEVARYDFGTFTVMAGPVPVVFVLDMVISVGASGRFEARLEASAAQSTHVQVGAEYTDDHGWRDLNEFDSDFAFPTPSITAAANARAFLRPQVDIKIYGLAGPYAYAEAFVTADAELHRDPFWTFSAGLDFGLGFVIDLPVVGEIAEWETELAGFEETLDESENGAPELELDIPNVVPVGRSVDLQAHATDREDGPFCCTYVWSSDVDGDLGSSSGIRPTFDGPGVRTITVTATDPDGATTEETATVHVADVTIDQPSGTFRQTDGPTFQATLEGFPEGSDPTIHWSYRDPDSGVVALPVTSKGGESFTFMDVACIDSLWVFAEVRPEGGEVVQGKTSVRCIPPEETFLYEPRRDLSGTVYSKGAVEIVGDGTTSITVGDNAVDLGMQGNLHFDIPALPSDPANVVRAELTVNLTRIVGYPYDHLNGLRAIHVDYGDSLDSADYGTTNTLPGMTAIPTDEGTGTQTVDVTTAVRDAWENGRSEVQFVLAFMHGTDGDGEAEFVEIAFEDVVDSTLVPALEITVQNY